MAGELNATLFPEDLNFKLIQALLNASEGNGGKEADAQLASLGALLDPEDAGGTQDRRGGYGRSQRREELGQSAGDSAIFNILMPLKAVNVRCWRMGHENNADAHMFLPLPPVLRQAYGQLFDTLMSYGTKDSKVVIAELEAIHRIHPDGTIRYVLALIHLNEGRLLEAEKEGLAAAEEPALYPIRRQALWVAGNAEGFLYAAPAQSRSKKEAESSRDAETMLAMIPKPHERNFAAKAMLYAGETNLASQILDEWEQSDRKSMMVPWLRARVKLREGAYLPAIEEARKVLKANPKDVETENLLKEATEKLLNDAKKVQPPEGARLMPWLPCAEKACQSFT